MAITNYLVHFLTEDTYNSKKSELRNDAVAFVKDATIIHTHGTDYYCGSGPVALESELSTVAKTGSYNDLNDKPSIPGEYVLPTASENTLGGVKIGNGIVLSGDTISVTTTSINAAAATHYHSASDITSGIFAISRIPTGTTNTTVALGNHTHSQYLEASDLSSYATKSELSSYATKTWVESQNYLTDVDWADISGRPDWITATKPSYTYSEISGTISASDLPVATMTTYGAVKLATDTTAYTMIQPITTTSNRTYGVQLDANDRMVVNVPWKESSTSLSDLGITVSATEINRLDGVSSNVQDQLNDKANKEHTHGSNDINSLTGYSEGTSTTTLSSSMTLNQALASLQNQIQDKQDSGNYALKSELTGYLPLTGGTMTGTLTLSNSLEFDTTSQNGSIKVGGNELVIYNNGSLEFNGSALITEDNWNDYITATDTKNTTGTSDSRSKLYLVGGTTQSAAGVQTYSNADVYTRTGYLYATRMYTTDGFYETSDARLKNFKDDIKALDIVSEIPTKYFTWKKDETDENSDPKLHIGTSAQEVQKIYPDLVTSNEDGVLSVDYARLSIIALAAIKELKEEINELKTKLS